MGENIIHEISDQAIREGWRKTLQIARVAPAFWDEIRNLYLTRGGGKSNVGRKGRASIFVSKCIETSSKIHPDLIKIGYKRRSVAGVQKHKTSRNERQEDSKSG